MSMQYINNEIGLIGHLLPDTYLADSVKDVKHNISQVRKPFRWTLKNSICEIGYPGEIIVILYNVDIMPESGHKYKIFDSTSDMIVDKTEGRSRIHCDSLPLSKIDQEYNNYQLVYLLHQPHSNMTSLYGAMNNEQLCFLHSKPVRVREKLVLIPKFYQNW
jgi:hypothetical protein